MKTEKKKKKKKAVDDAVVRTSFETNVSAAHTV